MLSGYDVAGVYVDGMYSSVGTCCCEHCRRKYRAEHGEEIPLDAWSPAWRDFGFQCVLLQQLEEFEMRCSVEIPAMR